MAAAALANHVDGSLSDLELLVLHAGAYTGSKRARLPDYLATKRLPANGQPRDNGSERRFAIARKQQRERLRLIGRLHVGQRSHQRIVGSLIGRAEKQVVYDRS